MPSPHIEKDRIPVDLLKLGDSGNAEDTIRRIESIVESHNPNMGRKQQTAVHAAISDMVQKGNVDMASLYEVLTSEQIPYDLADQLTNTLSFFVNFKANDRDWDELIDMLLMSLYYYQQAHGEKQLSIFIDEIKTQNLSTKGPIAKILTESRKNRNRRRAPAFSTAQHTAISRKPSRNQATISISMCLVLTKNSRKFPLQKIKSILSDGISKVCYNADCTEAMAVYRLPLLKKWKNWEK